MKHSRGKLKKGVYNNLESHINILHSICKRNLISKVRVGAKCSKSMNEIRGLRKCMVILKFLENIEGAVAPLAPSKLRLCM